MLGITVYIYICVPPYLPCGPAKVHFDVNIHIYIYIQARQRPLRASLVSQQADSAPQGLLRVLKVGGGLYVRLTTPHPDLA
jgi:hypothetical protein